MYQTHFGLEQAPFSITPNPAFFYGGNSRREILDALLYAVCHGEGIIKVTGEVGSGKTMLCRMLESALPDHIDVIYLVNPSLASDQVVFAIAGELHLPTRAQRGDEVLRLLQHDLIARHAAGRQVVLLVEEAQAMPLDTLEEIRLLTNLETARDKLLQIVLFGQPELDASLDLPRMRQLKERITHSFTVPAMTAELLPEFLAFRLHAAGYQGERLFSGQAVRRIAAASQGIVRRINILADKALLAAFADDAAQVSARHADAAIADSAFAVRKSGWRRLAMLALSATTLAAVLMAMWLLPQRFSAAAGAHAPAVAAMPTAMADTTTERLSPARRGQAGANADPPTRAAWPRRPARVAKM